MHKRILISLFIVHCSLFIVPFNALAHGGEHGELIIRMTENGFEPKTLTVTEGDEVLFINNDDTDRWPASNFHPQHTIYPEFDAKGGVRPGESWKFKFENVGTWRMHDHLIPHFTGSITVLEDPDKEVSPTTTTPVVEKASFWGKLKNFFLKFWPKPTSRTEAGIDSKLLTDFKSKDEKGKYAWLEERADIESPKIAWEYVVAAYSTPKGVTGNPHDMAHLVGQLIFHKYGLGGVSICNPSFAFGCYHGLMEVAFVGDTLVEYAQDLEDAQKGCQTIGEKTSPYYWSCIHGIGHGVATFRDYDLPPSLSDCDALETPVRTYCHDGVFMEFSAGAPANFYKPSDPLYPCSTVREMYKGACARSQTSVMASRMNLKTKEISTLCDESGNAQIIFHCIESLGFNAANQSNYSVALIVKTCREIENEKNSAQCLAAAAGELVFQNVTNWREKSAEVCNALPTPERKNCIDRIEKVAQSYGRK